VENVLFVNYLHHFLVEKRFLIDKQRDCFDYFISLQHKNAMFMLIRRVVSLVAMLALCLHVSAQVLRDSTDQVAAKMEMDGALRNTQRMMIGKVDEAGFVRNHSFMLVGRFKEGGTLVDANGRKMGQVSANGDVRDANSVLLGSIGLNGDVRDSKNRLIGRALNVPLYQAAVFYFFDLFTVRF